MSDTLPMIRPEVGKRYRTRDGEEVRIHKLTKTRAYGFLGRNHIGERVVWRWATTGKSLDSSGSLDLIECIGESDEPPTSRRP